MVSKILVPTDGSKAALRSLRYAIGLAEQLKAEIILLSVIDKSSLIPQTVPTSSNIIEPIEDFLKNAAQEYLNEGEKLCKKSGIPVKTVIRIGRPVDEIIKEAEKFSADLIVIGSRGRSAIKAVVLGSVTFGVINKETKIPVLVVRK
ncbi:MAG: universal stress protein [Nitrospirae bacterium]|jgi:nucleotide-binding universal stress UspA family protein|nr:universal stress protein [Nitrospirota bacterium]